MKHFHRSPHHSHEPSDIWLFVLLMIGLLTFLTYQDVILPVINSFIDSTLQVTK